MHLQLHLQYTESHCEFWQIFECRRRFYILTFYFIFAICNCPECVLCREYKKLDKGKFRIQNSNYTKIKTTQMFLPWRAFWQIVLCHILYTVYFCMAVSNSVSAVVYFCVKLAVAVKVEVACWQREVFEYLPSTNRNTIEIHIQI